MLTRTKCALIGPFKFFLLLICFYVSIINVKFKLLVKILELFKKKKRPQVVEYNLILKLEYICSGMGAFQKLA